MADTVRLNVDYFQVPNEIFDLDINVVVDEKKKVKGSKEVVTVKRPLKTYEKLIYIYLCRCGNQCSQAFPSYNTIAKQCGIGRVTAIEGVANLIKNGLLEKRPRKTKTKEGLIKDTSNEYFVLKPTKQLSGSLSEPVRQANPSSTPGEPEPVRQADPSSTPGEPKKELLKKNHIEKEPIKYSIKFLEWFEIYPNQFNKLQSFKNFERLLKEETFENIMTATRNYIAYLERKGNVDKQYIVRSTNFVGQKKEYLGYLEMKLDTCKATTTGKINETIDTLKNMDLEEE